MSEISLRRLSWRQWSEFAADWERIHAASPGASYFVSRQWVDCWLATFGEELKPDIFAFLSDGQVVGCCLLVWRTQWVRGIPLRRVFLNCTGEDETHSTYIEFNSLLSLPSHAEAVAKALGQFLKTRYWDELLLYGVIDQEAIGILFAPFGRVEVSEMPSRFINFAQLRERRQDYLDVLSAKTRYHIRRTQRSFEEAGGELTCQVARTLDEGLEMMRQLADLHQSRWESRGEAGAFSSAKFYSLHEKLLRQDFDHVLLFRIRAGSEVVGMLHCFLHRRWVYYYQSGFCYTTDKRRSPGLLTLYHVISHCLAQKEIDGFDFMAGDQEYKRSLTADTDIQTLKWRVVRRNTVASLLFLGLRNLKRRYVEFRKGGRRPGQRQGGSEPSVTVEGGDPGGVVNSASR